jgi:serine/threonine-protein kinase PknG
MTPCNRPDCPGGHIVPETDHCDGCGRRRLEAPASSSSVRSARSSARRGGSGRSLDLVGLPAVSAVDPTSRIMADPQIPESQRTCAVCGWPIGRSYGRQAARTEGWCPNCGSQFSLRPTLATGDLVQGRYRVDGCTNSGGQGYIYLARDGHLDDSLVVLKGLVNSADRHAVDLAVRERQALQRLDHPGIVRIIDAVTHPDPRTDALHGYIVMPYLPGRSLREVIQGGSAALLDRPLVAEDVVGCGLEILAALDYLHGQGLLFCDMKPANVMLLPQDEGQTGRVKIVDLGGVTAADAADRLDDLPQVVTRGYGEGEEPSVQRDLLATARTLHELAWVAVDSPRWRLEDPPGPAGDVALRSFHLLLRRGADLDRGLRFSSAAEMAEQLRGVERELRSLRTGRPSPAPSTAFVPAATLLDAGLGAAPELTRWTDAVPPAANGSAGSNGSAAGGSAAGVLGQALSVGRPAPALAAVGLPAVQVDPDDPAAALLAQTRAPDSRRLVEKLADYRESGQDGAAESPGLEWLACHAWIELGDMAQATDCLARARRLQAEQSERPDWRLAWYDGLIALGNGDLATAQARFETVYAAVPGELAPKLALGYCAEELDQPGAAEPYYAAVWSRDRSVASAAFGLARISLSRVDRAGAMRRLDEVPQVSRHYDAARLAAINVLSGRLPAAHPSPGDFNAAAERLGGLYLDSPARDRLTTAIREAVLDWFPTEQPAAPATVFGMPAQEEAIRLELEKSFRILARQARTADDHGVLVDLANAVRPRTWT